MEDMINQSKKCKTEENDIVSLTQQDARKILQPLTKDQLIDILQTVITHDVAALSAVRSIADTDPSHRKLFIRSIGWETSTATLKSVFEVYGEVEEGVVIVDKVTNKSKGYSFVTFKHVDGAVKALVEPSKKINGRIIVAQLASARDVVNNNNVTNRKVYVGNVPWEIGTERMLECFAAFGEIEEGPLGFNKQYGRDKGFAFFIYKSEEGARKAVVDSVKSIDEYQVMWKKGRAGGVMTSPRCPDGAVEAFAGNNNTLNNVLNKKVYVGNIPWEVGSEKLLECFAAFGEIEEGPLGFDKQSGKEKGFAFFIYKSEEGARRAVVDSVKSIDGHQVICKMAMDRKKGRAGGGMMSPRGLVSGTLNTDGRTSYSGYPDGTSMLPHQNLPPSGTGSGPGYVNQGPPEGI